MLLCKVRIGMRKYEVIVICSVMSVMGLNGGVVMCMNRKELFYRVVRVRSLSMLEWCMEGGLLLLWGGVCVLFV